MNTTEREKSDKEESKEYWVLQYGNGKFMAIDHSSGGYPYPTDIVTAHKFYKKEEADVWINRDCWKSEGFKVRKVRTCVVD